jgi:hypothetical protein
VVVIYTCNGIKSENLSMDTYYKIYSIEVGFASRAVGGAAGVLVRGLCKIFFYWLHPPCRLILSVWFPSDQPYQRSLTDIYLVSRGPTLPAKSYRYLFGFPRTNPTSKVFTDICLISLGPTLPAKSYRYLFDLFF